MSLLLDARRGLDAALIGRTRKSQAAVIEALDRLVGGPEARRKGAPRSALGRLLNFHLEVMDVCFGDVASVTDASFDCTARLLALHREFLQRIIEAVDTRDAARFLTDGTPLAPVVHLGAREAPHR